MDKILINNPGYIPLIKMICFVLGVACILWGTIGIAAGILNKDRASIKSSLTMSVTGALFIVLRASTIWNIRPAWVPLTVVEVLFIVTFIVSEWMCATYAAAHAPETETAPEETAAGENKDTA